MTSVLKVKKKKPQLDYLDHKNHTDITETFLLAHGLLAKNNNKQLAWYICININVYNSTLNVYIF